MARGHLTFRKKLLRPSNLPFICFYCGEPATDKEHVVPKSLVGNNTHIIWSCGECNSIASDNLFSDIESKRDFIQEKIATKYHKYLNQPDWTEKEISELGRGLKSTIRSSQRIKSLVKNRLAWAVKLEVLIATKYLELADDADEEKEIGLSQLEINAALKSEVKLCISEKEYFKNLTKLKI